MFVFSDVDMVGLPGSLRRCLSILEARTEKTGDPRDRAGKDSCPTSKCSHGICSSRIRVAAGNSRTAAPKRHTFDQTYHHHRSFTKKQEAAFDKDAIHESTSPGDIITPLSPFTIA